MAIDPVLLRTALVDKNDRITREWARQQIQLTQAVITTEQLVESVSPFDERNFKDFTPDIEAAQSIGRETPRVYDDAELRQSLAAGDTSRPYDDSDLRSQLAGLDAPNLSFQQQIDELRALLAAQDPPRGGASGTFTTADSKTVTVQAGLIISIV